MTLTVRRAEAHDLPFLQRHDRHPSRPALERAVGDGRVSICEEDGERRGWLRWSLFWDEHPFLNMLFVLEEYRGKGRGALALTVWEEEMRASGHRLLLTSTPSDERSQHLYRRQGYRDAGVLVVPGDVAELLMLKDLAEPADRR